MTKPHKWSKEIKAWADGAEIEIKWGDGNWSEVDKPSFNIDENVNVEYRIKPQPKEPQYLYVYFDPNYGVETKLIANKNAEPPRGMHYLGKIKLENENES